MGKMKNIKEKVLTKKLLGEYWKGVSTAVYARYRLEGFFHTLTRIPTVSAEIIQDIYIRYLNSREEDPIPLCLLDSKIILKSTEETDPHSHP